MVQYLTYKPTEFNKNKGLVRRSDRLTTKTVHDITERLKD